MAAMPADFTGMEATLPSFPMERISLDHSEGLKPMKKRINRKTVSAAILFAAAATLSTSAAAWGWSCAWWDPIFNYCWGW